MEFHMTDARSVRTARTTLWVTLTRLLHRIIGAPDYAAYVEHVRRSHPGTTPLGEDEFFRQRLDDRYTKMGARCC